MRQHGACQVVVVELPSALAAGGIDWPHDFFMLQCVEDRSGFRLVADDRLQLRERRPLRFRPLLWTTLEHKRMQHGCRDPGPIGTTTCGHAGRLDRARYDQ